MGNRGRLHDAGRRLVRHHVGSYRAWVTCVLAFKDRRRLPMTPGRYTELFFLDEATALAAGHRPCAECRRADYRRFKAAWLSGNATLGFDLNTPIEAIDRVLHRDRLSPDGTQCVFRARLDELPDGVFVTWPDLGDPHLVWRGGLWPWSLRGYALPTVRPAPSPVIVLTPRSTVNALRAGYCPMVHESALKQPSESSTRRARRGPAARGGPDPDRARPSP